MTALSLRRLWTIHKQVAIDHGRHCRPELGLLQGALYSGARCVLMVPLTQSKRKRRPKAALSWG
jgi:hypothetical protein